METIITCSKCNKERNISEFRTDNHHKLGIHPHCRDCYNENQRKYREQNRKDYNDKALKRYHEKKDAINKRRRERYAEKKKNPTKLKGSAKKQNQKPYHERDGYKKQVETNWKRQGIKDFTYDQYEEMLAKQQGKCAVCGDPPKTNKLSVDHNHDTGKVREILCYNCNAALGMCKEDPELLRKLINYLDKHE